MVVDYITFAEGTGRYSKQVETYNFHKAASVLAEYGFDCIRLADDWRGADFLAHHRDKEITLSVQLKASLSSGQEIATLRGTIHLLPIG